MKATDDLAPPGSHSRRIVRVSIFAAVVVAFVPSCSDRNRGERAEDDLFAVTIIGGSTARGEPYHEIGGFSAAIHQLLRDRFAGRSLAVRNLGRGGIDSAEALKTAKKISDAADLVILYAGNNEFLRFDTERSPLTERPQFDVPVADESERRRVLQRYEENVRAIATQLRRKKIPLIVCTVAVNLADWQPNRSVLSNPANETEIRALHAKARDAMRSGALGEAAGALVGALEIEPGFAATHQLLGDVRREMGLFDQAREDYQAANDLDGNPCRAVSSQNEFLRHFAVETDGVFLVDAAELVASRSANRLPGFDMFWDNCHPLLEGYYLIGRGIAQRMSQVFAASESLDVLPADRLVDGLGLSELQLAEVYHSRGQFLYASASRSWARAERLARAISYLEQAEKLDPSADVAFSMGIARAIDGDRDAARAQWRLAAARDARAAKKRFESPTVRRLIEERGWQGIIEF